MTDDARPTLVFFWSTRSGPARRMESLIAHFARKDRNRLRVVKVDVDERRDLAERLSVKHVPTLVLLANRRLIARIDGRASAPRITAMLEEHLEPARPPELSAAAGRSPRA
jgi:thioredoxin-like negative regulator of GroEL